MNNPLFAEYKIVYEKWTSAETAEDAKKLECVCVVRKSIGGWF